MTTARDVLLEVKRRLGDTNTPTPNEADALAFLNRALLGIYNYGIYRQSDRLKKVEEFQSGENGVVVIPDKVWALFGVGCKDNSKILAHYQNLMDYFALDERNEGPAAYAIGPTQEWIKLYPAPKEPVTVVIEYIPELKKLTKRSEDVPFTPDLENIVVDWTCGLILGKQSSMSDYEYATSHGYANTLGQYFRGVDKRREIVGHGPW